MSMKPENRAFVNVLVAVAVVVGFAGAYLLLSPTALAASLPVPAGTVFTSNDTVHWVAHFAVGPAGGRLVGAWTAYDGSGFVGLVVGNGTVAKPPPPGPVVECPLLLAWAETNGTVDRVLAPGPYTVYWGSGVCSYAASIDVTQTLQVVGP